MHRVHMERFNLKKLNEVEGKVQHHVEISNRLDPWITLTLIELGKLLTFSVFTFIPAVLLPFVCFSLWYLYYQPVDSHHQHRRTTDMSHLISVPPGFQGPSQ
jgi:hypothetical protein